MPGGAANNNVLQPKVVEACLGENTAAQRGAARGPVRCLAPC